VMISIRSNFFYTRTVPCELWFFDRGKKLPSPTGRGAGGEGKSFNDKNHVLMLDARNIYRKVTRKIYDFSPEQMRNLSAVVWLYRGEQERFLALVRDYNARVCAEAAAVPALLTAFEATLADLRGHIASFEKVVLKQILTKDTQKPLANALAELHEADNAYETDRARLTADLDTFRKKHVKSPPDTNDKQHAARKAFDPVAEAIRGLIKQVDLIYKLAARAADACAELASEAEKLPLPPGEGRGEGGFDRRSAGRLVKQLDDERKAAVEQLRHTAYFHRQIAWLHDRFPQAELQAVPGLVKLVNRKDIEAADWSLTPGRYVGVAPPDEDEDFDFEQTLTDIHAELADLNKEAVTLAKKIQANFEELGA